MPPALFLIPWLTVKNILTNSQDNLYYSFISMAY